MARDRDMRGGAADGTPPAGDAFSAYRGFRYFSNLDGLRFICIAMVLWHHGQPLKIDELRILQRGFLGVDFFFVLSGFLITTLLLREESVKGFFSLRGFYWRRILRIIPVYFFVVSAVSFYYIVVQGQTQYLELLPFYYLFLSNFLIGDIPTLAPTWSLSVEEQYYVLWPLMLLMLPRRWIVPALLVIIGVHLVVNAGFGGSGRYVVEPLSFGLGRAGYMPILIGSLLAIALHHRQSFEPIHRLLGGFWAAPACFLVLMVLLQMLPADVRGFPDLVIDLAMAATIASLVIRERTALSPFLTNRLIARCGEISYGTYLYHLIALHVTVVGMQAAGLSDPWLKLIGYSILSFVMAEISFRTLEAYFRRFRTLRLGRPAASTG